MCLENFSLDLFHMKVTSSVFTRVMFILITAIQYRLETFMLLSLSSMCIFASLVLPLTVDDMFMHPLLYILYSEGGISLIISVTII